MPETSPNKSRRPGLPRSQTMAPVGAVLDKAIQDLGLGEAVAKGAAMVLWPEVVGEAVARVTHPQTVRGRTLVVTVVDSAWLQQLRYLEETMLEGLNAALGRQVIEGIYLQVGQIPVAPPADEPPEASAELAPEAAAYLEDVVSDVDDPGLRATLRRVLAASRPIEEDAPS